MTSDVLRSLLSGPFSLTARPEPIAGDLRMSWGLSVLLLSLFYSRGKKGHLRKLQFLGHAVRLPENRADVRDLLRGELRSTDITVRIEPWLNRAIAYAQAMKLVSVERGRTVLLIARGLEVAKELEKLGEPFADEREFLREVAPKLNELLLERIWRMEDLL